MAPGATTNAGRSRPRTGKPSGGRGRLRGMYFVAISFIPLLIAIAIVLLGARAVWVSVTLPKKVPREAACGGCGYAVAGLDGSICPECGADFRRVGISTPQFVLKWRGGYFSAILGWTLVMLMIGIVGMYVVAMLSFTRSMTTVANTTSTITKTFTPGSLAYKFVRFDGTQGFDQDGSINTIELVLTKSDYTISKFELDVSSLTYTVDIGEGPGESSSFRADSISVWFEDSGLDIADPKVANEITDLGSVVDFAIITPLGLSNIASLTTSFPTQTPTVFGSGRATTSPGTTNEALIAVITGIVMFAVWIGGIVWIVRRRSRLLRAAA